MKRWITIEELVSKHYASPTPTFNAIFSIAGICYRKAIVQGSLMCYCLVELKFGSDKLGFSFFTFAYSARRPNFLPRQIRTCRKFVWPKELRYVGKCVSAGWL